MKNSYLLLIWILLFTLSSCRNEPAGPVKEIVTRVRTKPVESETISLPVHTSGILAASEEMKLSFKAGGLVATINVKEGDMVKQNRVLAKLNLSEVRATVNIAERSYEKANRDWERAKNLYNDTVATLEQFQNASTALDVAKANLEIARFNLRHSTINAPADGTILKQLVRENELISAGYPVFLFGVSGESWKIKSGLSDRDIVNINTGDSASVAFDAWPGVKFPAEVEQISGLSNPMTGTYDVELNLGGSGYKLAAGFIASLDIFPSKKLTVLKVPVGSIVDADGEAGYIFTVDQSGKAEKMRINIISITGTSAAVSGIPGNVNEVISEGAAYLKDGMKVMIVK